MKLIRTCSLVVVMIFLSVGALSASAHAQTPSVTFTIESPAEFVPDNNTSYIVQLKYAVTGRDLRNVRISIDLPKYLVLFGQGSVDSFTSYCGY